LATALTGLTGTAEAADTAAIVTAPAFSAYELVNHPARNWITKGGNAWTQRYSALDQINRSNVAGL